MPLGPVVAEKIRKQVEFYFSDSNLPRDKFLLQKAQAHPEGYVDLALICAFKRMLNLLHLPPDQRPDEIPNATIHQVAAVLAESPALEICKERDHVRRAQPLADQGEILQEIDSRTIYSKPLPFDSSIDGLLQQFGRFAPVLSVRLRRYTASKEFKGSVFVEFETKEEAIKAVSESKIVIAGAPQQLELKVDYMQRKNKKHKKRAEHEAANATVSQSQDPAVAAGQDPIAAFQSTPEKDEGLKRKRLEENQPDSAHKQARLPGPPPRATAPFTPGVALKLEIPHELADDSVDFQCIKDALGGKEAGVGHVEYVKGSELAWIRMYTTNSAKDLLDKKKPDGKLALHLNGKNVDMNVILLQGAEEEAFHRKVQEKRLAAEAKRASGGGAFKSFNNSGGRGSRGRGGHGRGRFGRRGRVI